MFSKQVTADHIKVLMCSYMQRPKVVKGFLPPAVITDSGQHSLCRHSGGGQHFHCLGCSPVQQVSCCAHRGAHSGSTSLG